MTLTELVAWICKLEEITDEPVFLQKSLSGNSTWTSLVKNAMEYYKHMKQTLECSYLKYPSLETEITIR